MVAAVLEEAALRPATLGAAATAETGTPTEAPPEAMLSALRTWAAAIVMLPVARMPASPASTVPRGASRVTAPGSTPATEANTPMPPPVAKPPKSVSMSALIASMSTRVGGAVTTVLAAVPAAMSPRDDQMVRSPPRRVKMRARPISILPPVRRETSPPYSVTIPGGVSGLPKISEAMVMPPPGAAAMIDPPEVVRRSRARVKMLPAAGPRPKTASTAA